MFPICVASFNDVYSESLKQIFSDQHKKGVYEMTKRAGGQLTGSKVFIVLTESTQLPDGGWKHKCGHDVMNSNVALSHRMGDNTLVGDGSVENKDVPFCPNCETKPVSGEYQDNGKWFILYYEQENAIK